MSTPSTASLRNLASEFTASLEAFASSPTTFRVLRTLGVVGQSSHVLYVLDSSFNPPTRAHLRLATDALSSSSSSSSSAPKRLLLLLATQNADKAPRPASPEQRLAMMTMLARDIVDHPAEVGRGPVAVDVGVTKHPYFVDKCAAVAASDEFGGHEQVHLLGFDTFTRLLDPKYYRHRPHGLGGALGELFARHRVRVAYRAGDGFGGREEQDAYLRALRDGAMEAEGARREWADRVEMVDGRNDDGELTSSTRAREAAGKGDAEGVRRMCPPGVAEWILEQRLYVED